MSSGTSDEKCRQSLCRSKAEMQRNIRYWRSQPLALDSIGHTLSPIVPEPIEQCGGQGCKFASHAHVTVALACFAVERARVQALDIKAAQESLPFVHDQELAVIAGKIAHQIERPEGMKAANLYPGLT